MVSLRLHAHSCTVMPVSTCTPRASDQEAANQLAWHVAGEQVLPAEAIWHCVVALARPLLHRDARQHLHAQSWPLALCPLRRGRCAFVLAMQALAERSGLCLTWQRSLARTPCSCRQAVPCWLQLEGH